MALKRAIDRLQVLVVHVCNDLLDGLANFVCAVEVIVYGDRAYYWSMSSFARFYSPSITKIVVQM